MHRMFRHAKEDDILKRLEKAKVPKSTQALVKQVVRECRFCREWQKPKERPTFKSRPCATRVGERMESDHFFYDKDFMALNTIDEHSRLEMGWPVDSRSVPTTIEAFEISVIRVIGMPEQVSVDPAGELISEEIGVHLGERGCKRDILPAEDWTKHSLKEKHHDILRGIMRRLLSEFPNMDRKVAYFEALDAKNEGLDIGGFSPYQLAFGKNPRSIAPNSKPASGHLDGDCQPSDAMAEKLKIKAAARHAFIEVMNEVQLHQMMKHRQRCTEEFKIGDEIDIWRAPGKKSISGWRGPAEITSINKEGRITASWQGSTMYPAKHHARHHIPDYVLTSYDEKDMWELSERSAEGLMR